MSIPAKLCFLIPLGASIATVGLLVGLGVLGWVGDVRISDSQFCEVAQEGAIRQPANTFSNIGFYVVGLWIGW